MIPRRRLQLLFVVPAFAALATSVGCGGGPEESILRKYFQASRMRDNTTLANIATVSFSPSEQGTVTDFSVESVSPEQRRPLKVRELATAEEEARKADDDFNKRKKEYQDANLTAIERVLKAESGQGKVGGKDVEVQKAWMQWRDDASSHAKKLADARKALSGERSLADSSIYDARNPVDPTKFDGELVQKDCTIKATIRTPSGESQDRTMRVRLTRAELSNGPEGKTIEGRWIVTSINDAGSGGGAPTSN